MFSEDYKKKISTKYNISNEIINSSIHYKVPNYIFKSKNGINNQCIYHYPTDNIFNFQVHFKPELLLDNRQLLKKLNKTQYMNKRMKEKDELISKIQKEKINLLIQRSYNKINNNIRKYNKSLTLPKQHNNIKVKPLPIVSKNKIIEHILQRYKIYMDKNKNIDNHYNLINEKMKKQYIWSHNILEEKKIKEYKKIYRIKYLENNNNKLKNEGNLPNLTKLKYETF